MEDKKSEKGDEKVEDYQDKGDIQYDPEHQPVPEIKQEPVLQENEKSGLDEKKEEQHKMGALIIKPSVDNLEDKLEKGMSEEQLIKEGFIRQHGSIGNPNYVPFKRGDKLYLLLKTKDNGEYKRGFVISRVNY